MSLGHGMKTMTSILRLWNYKSGQDRASSTMTPHVQYRWKWMHHSKAWGQPWSKMAALWLSHPRRSLIRSHDTAILSVKCWPWPMGYSNSTLISSAGHSPWLPTTSPLWQSVISHCTRHHRACSEYCWRSRDMATRSSTDPARKWYWLMPWVASPIPRTMEKFPGPACRQCWYLPCELCHRQTPGTQHGLLAQHQQGYWGNMQIMRNLSRIPGRKPQGTPATLSCPFEALAVHLLRSILHWR